MAMFPSAFATDLNNDEKPKTVEIKDVEVKKGDTLWGISKKYFGQGISWKKIHELNGDIDNPNLIYPGQFLILDDLPPTASVDSVEPKEEIGSGAEADSEAVTTDINQRTPVPHLTNLTKSEEEARLQEFRELYIAELGILSVDVDAGIAFLKLLNDDLQSNNLYFGGVVGVDTLINDKWGARMLARSSISKLSGTLVFKPLWLSVMAQYQAFRKQLHPKITMAIKLNAGSEYYKNFGAVQSQRFVNAYSGLTLGTSLKFLLGTRAIYSTGGDIIHTFFSGGSKTFLHGNVYRRFAGTRWSVGAGYWVDILNTNSGFQEKIFSIETHLRYTF